MKCEDLHVRVDPSIGEYLDALLATGLFGVNRSQVARTLIEIGVRKAVENGTITLRFQRKPTP